MTFSVGTRQETHQNLCDDGTVTSLHGAKVEVGYFEAWNSTKDVIAEPDFG